ncbi:hypothetical protein N8Z10_00195 [bacterium]|nr:hypothetical protein [bacterium]
MVGILISIAILIGGASLYLSMVNAKKIKTMSITQAGPVGKDGKDGKDGVAGPMGAQGMTGPQGKAGIAGKAGKAGKAGVAGPMGPMDDSLRTEAEEFVEGRLNEIIVERIEERLNGEG